MSMKRILLVFVVLAVCLLCGSVNGEIVQHLSYEPDDVVVAATVPNLFLDMKTTASGHWSDRVPKFAVDGKKSNAGTHWAGENIPVNLTVELAEAKKINNIRLWTHWDGRRYYQYHIEGSLDGVKWAKLVDQQKNTEVATAMGESFFFADTKVKFVRVTFTKNSAGNSSGGHIVEIEGYALPAAVMAKEKQWQNVTAGLHGSFGSIDKRYSRGDVPDVGSVKEWSAVAWRGERTHAQILLWAGSDLEQVRFSNTALKAARGREIAADAVTCRFVRYTRGASELYADVLDTAKVLLLEGQTVRPLWVTVDVPSDAKPGIYNGQVSVKAAGNKELTFGLKLEVLGLTVPPASQWPFHLDLWQNPYSVARYHRVEPWSDEHFALLKPLMVMLAEAGQKCVTTSIVFEPWGGQTFDPFDTMIEWIRGADGSWSYDYSVFDKWVEFCETCGIDKQINCYSMIPWSNRFRYLDAADGDHKFLYAVPGTKEYEQHWGAFLADFQKHLNKKGWLDKTTIAMDERPHAIMEKLFEFMDRVAPNLKITSAVNYPTKEMSDLHDISIAIQYTGKSDLSMMAKRASENKPTTFYVCTSPRRPNTFTHSPPVESTWLGWNCAAKGFSGFLRWAYMSWVEEPLYDTRYVRWPAGDCFVVYPDARSSVRFERLREGFVDFEKVRIVKAMLKKKGAAGASDMKKLDDALALFDYGRLGSDVELAENVNKAKAALTEISRGLQ